MSSLPRDLDLEGIGRGVDGSRANDNRAGRVMSIEVAGEDHLDVRERPLLHHPAGARPQLLSWLENEPHGQRWHVAIAEQLGRAQQHRHVAVVPAGVHDARHFRGELEAGLFLDRQAIHLSPKRYEGAVGPAGDLGDHSVPRHTVPVGYGPLVQIAADSPRRRRLLVAELRPLVQLPSDGDQLLPQVGRHLYDAHGMRLRRRRSCRNREVLVTFCGGFPFAATWNTRAGRGVPASCYHVTA